MKRRSPRAFTLVELLVVVAIIGILVAAFAGGAVIACCGTADAVPQQSSQLGRRIS